MMHRLFIYIFDNTNVVLTSDEIILFTFQSSLMIFFNQKPNDISYLHRHSTPHPLSSTLRKITDHSLTTLLQNEACAMLINYGYPLYIVDHYI